MGYWFDIGIWLTQDLDTNGVGDPRQVLKDFIPENFSEAGHNVNLTVHSATPSPPRENVVDTGWPQNAAPCGNWISFSNLMDWWEDWHTCNGQWHDDANLLVTNYDSTFGLTSGNCNHTTNHHCVAEASKIGDLEDESLGAYGKDLRYSQMYGTVLHEIGHAVIDETGSYTCGGNPANEEQMATSYKNSQGRVITSPMVSWGTSNECCSGLVKEPNTAWFTRSYSQCVQDHLVNCLNK